jgi:nucleolar complex protein 3
MSKGAGKKKSPSVTKEASGTWKKRKRTDVKKMTPKQIQMSVKLDTKPEACDQVRSSWAKQSGNTGTKLPVLGRKGKWKEDESRRVPDESVESESEADDVAAPKAKKPKASKSFEEIRLELANMALLLQEAPQENMRKLGEMRTFADPAKQGDPRVVQLALVTLLAVLKDLMPGYAIRALSEEETAGPMISKDVKAVRAFEQSFLSHYKAYLQRLQKCLQGEDEANKILANACVADLLASVSHFNYYEDLVKWAVQGALGRDQVVRTACCQAITLVLRDDVHGKATCTIIRQMSDMVKERDYRAVPAEALKALLSAKIRTDVAGQMPNASVVAAPKLKRTASKRDKKEAKAQLKRAQQIADAEAVVSKEEQERWMSDALRYLFRIYFGVLKKHGSSMGEDEVLGGVLEGLGHFAHLISQETYFGDLLRALKALTEASKPLSLQSSLQCILTVAKIQALQEKAMALDLKFVYTFLFQQLPRLSEVPSSAWVDGNLLALLRDIFRVLLGPKLAVSTTRLAAFAQRLVDVALASEGIAAESILVLLHGFLADHLAVRSALLDKDGLGHGSYVPACHDPDLCHSLARPILPLIQRILSNPKASPAVKAAAKKITQLHPNK